MTAPMEDSNSQALRLLQSLATAKGVPSQYVLQKSKEEGLRATKDLLELGLIAIFDGRAHSLDKFKDWAITVWEQKLQLHLIHSRYVGKNTFLTIFAEKAHRDKAPTAAPPIIRDVEARLMPWSPNAESKGFSLKLTPMWVKLVIHFINTSALDQGHLQNVGGSYQISSHFRGPYHDSARALILWDSTKEIPDYVDIKIEESCEYSKTTKLRPLPLRHLRSSDKFWNPDRLNRLWPIKNIILLSSGKEKEKLSQSPPIGPLASQKWLLVHRSPPAEDIPDLNQPMQQDTTLKGKEFCKHSASAQSIEI
ncbi:hypothetical protein R1sor_004586 [Riccia sorocarpa]|uniref:Uncharacterized protein n=1 Tax=Riccia sorocarpa TaxID=122646 RepID=A0ABD3HLG4_9MARC